MGCNSYHISGHRPVAMYPKSTSGKDKSFDDTKILMLLSLQGEWGYSLLPTQGTALGYELIGFQPVP